MPSLSLRLAIMYHTVEALDAPKLIIKCPAAVISFQAVLQVMHTNVQQQSTTQLASLHAGFHIVCLTIFSYFVYL